MSTKAGPIAGRASARQSPSTKPQSRTARHKATVPSSAGAICSRPADWPESHLQLERLLAKRGVEAASDFLVCLCRANRSIEVCLPDEIARKVAIVAAQTGTTIEDVLRFATKKFLDRVESVVVPFKVAVSNPQTI